MLTKEPSFASLLVKQSPAMHYGHGWIYLPCGKKWHQVLNYNPGNRLTGEEIKSDSYKDLWLTWQTTCEPSEKFSWKLRFTSSTRPQAIAALL